MLLAVSRLACVPLLVPCSTLNYTTVYRAVLYRRVKGWGVSCAGVSCQGKFVKFEVYRFEGAADSSKTRLNLVFEYKVDIVVCILVKVYNMKKNTGLIVTVVSITSLYFYYI